MAPIMGLLPGRALKVNTLPVRVKELDEMISLRVPPGKRIVSPVDELVMAEARLIESNVAKVIFEAKVEDATSKKNRTKKAVLFSFRKVVFIIE
jgi:hypothetical protein